MSTVWTSHCGVKRLQGTVQTSKVRVGAQRSAVTVGEGQAIAQHYSHVILCKLRKGQQETFLLN